MRILHTPWLFRIPGFRRFHGYEVGPLILIRRPLGEVSDDLIVHELCHVWQDQHRRLRMWLSYLYRGYRDNPHEVEARRAAAETRHVRSGPCGRTSTAAGQGGWSSARASWTARDRASARPRCP